MPVAVFSAYPGRTLRRVNVGIPEIDPARIPSDTEVVALAGSDDRVVGSRVARRIARSTGGRLVLVTDPRASDHLGPAASDAASRRAFWDPPRRADSARPRLATLVPCLV